MNDWKNNVIQDTNGLQEIIRNTKTIAVLGIKPESHADQPAHYVPAHMAAAGFEIIPVPVYYPQVTENEDDQRDGQRDERGAKLSRPASDAQRGDEPDRRGGGQAAHHIVAALQNRAAAEEPDAGDDALDDARDHRGVGLIQIRQR